MRIPSSTYRIQFNTTFGFDKASAIVDYLHELGITFLYASPVFKAKKGSPHGYDVVDQNQLNPELGGNEGFDSLINALKKHDMGWLQDVVPNHMAFDGENEKLMDVLENGANSQYFDFFDIEWNHPYESIKGRVLAPFLGRLYGVSLEDGEITLKYDSEGFTINYYDHKFPLKIESYINVITHRLKQLKCRLDKEHPDFIKLLGILYSLKNMPDTGEGLVNINDHVRFIKRIFWELYSRSAVVKNFIDENIKIFNGEKGNPESLNLLDTLLSEQNFNLSFWKMATEELNYRRFFNINGLISLKMEEEGVFDQTHSLILDLIKKDKFNGLRIDHIDGLYDPTNYLKRVKETAGDVYVVVEKILEFDETLPHYWLTEGTTGYDYMNMVNFLFCDSQNEDNLQKIYSGFAEFRTNYEDLLYEKKKLIIEKDMTGDIDNLAHQLKGISSRDRHGSDITLYGLKEALIEVFAFFPVYRTYINQKIFGETDCHYIREALYKARKRNPSLLYELKFIERFMRLDFADYLPVDEVNDWIRFVMRLQQFTGPLMAKGFEDTTLYIYNRLISLNDVGGNPRQFGISLNEFHDYIIDRKRSWPYAMNTTSTHDTKRGEDVRARINVLSEIPKEWQTKIKEWDRINRKNKTMANDIEIPDRNDEYFLYQTLIGTFPFNWEDYSGYIDRIKDYIIKAVREAKVHTAWLTPDDEYESAFLDFVEQLLDTTERNKFLRSFHPFMKKVAAYGIYNTLSQTLIKITSPGVADFYQGSELWDLSLVDPDNRRPVDFELRGEILRDIKEREKEDIISLLNKLVSAREDGRIKFYLTYKGLNIRREKQEIFLKGDYLPLKVEGRFKDNILAYARIFNNEWAITIAPRFLTDVIDENELPFGMDIWRDTCINLPDNAPSKWVNALTEESISGEKTIYIGKCFLHFPVAWLFNEA